MKIMKPKTEIVVTEIVAPTALSAISVVNPAIGLVATFLYGATRTIAKWKSDRISEANERVGINKIVELINRDDKTRDILHRILENVIDESSEEKREVFYTYIKNLDKNNDVNFDYHSKIIATINAITLEELEALFMFSRHFREIEVLNNKQDINTKLPSGLNISQIVKHRSYEEVGHEYLENVFNTLANYGLIYATFGRYDGTMFGPVTYFGKKFMEYITTDESST